MPSPQPSKGAQPKPKGKLRGLCVDTEGQQDKLIGLFCMQLGLGGTGTNVQMMNPRPQLGHPNRLGSSNDLLLLLCEP